MFRACTPPATRLPMLVSYLLGPCISALIWSRNAGAAGGKLIQRPSFHPARFRRHKLRLFPKQPGGTAELIDEPAAMPTTTEVHATALAPTSGGSTSGGIPPKKRGQAVGLPDEFAELGHKLAASQRSPPSWHWKAAVQRRAMQSVGETAAGSACCHSAGGQV
jgi:hypothetical protein